MKKSDIDENMLLNTNVFWLNKNILISYEFVFLQHFSYHSGLDVYNFIEKENYTAADVIL